MKPVFSLAVVLSVIIFCIAGAAAASRNDRSSAQEGKRGSPQLLAPVSPAGPSAIEGASALVTTKGRFHDGAMRDMTASANSNGTAATVNTSGVASAAAGSGTIFRFASAAGSTVAPRLLHKSSANCTYCHPSAAVSPAGPQGKPVTLTETVPGLCYRCHPRFVAKKSFHAPVEGGACTACHDPHDTGAPHLLAKPLKEVCLSCHTDTLDEVYLHGPAAVGDCTFCHEPHASANARLLVKSGADLCISCHFDMQNEMKKPVVHPALSAGCTSCHDPHGSSERRLLPEAGAALCFSCHPAIESKVSTSAQSVHQPIRTARSCASCHAPHASDGPKLLPKAGKDFCLGCHKDLIKKSDTVLHGPIKGGTCVPCHDPHGSPNEKLLVKPYSSDFYVSYDDTSFQLCFKCHNRDLLRNPTTTSATRFRDGDRNLHYLHVNRKDLGKACKVCHVIHGGENPKLIATKVPFGTWKLPLKFVKTETGGKCAPGCHQPFIYSNQTITGGAVQPTAEKDRDRKRM